MTSIGQENGHKIYFNILNQFTLLVVNLPLTYNGSVGCEPRPTYVSSMNLIDRNSSKDPRSINYRWRWQYPLVTLSWLQDRCLRLRTVVGFRRVWSHDGRRLKNHKTSIRHGIRIDLSSGEEEWDGRRSTECHRVLGNTFVKESTHGHRWKRYPEFGFKYPDRFPL